MAHDNITDREFIPLNIAVLTVSDSRTEATDKSGGLLKERLTAAGHKLADKKIDPDDIYRIRATVAEWIAAKEVHAVINYRWKPGFTGRDGDTGSDRTPARQKPLPASASSFGRFRHRILVLQQFNRAAWPALRTAPIYSACPAPPAHAKPAGMTFCRRNWTIAPAPATWPNCCHV